LPDLFALGLRPGFSCSELIRKFPAIFSKTRLYDLVEGRASAKKTAKAAKFAKKSKAPETDRPMCRTFYGLSRGSPEGLETKRLCRHEWKIDDALVKECAPRARLA
jgi:hypothetical protein